MRLDNVRIGATPQVVRYRDEAVCGDLDDVHALGKP